MKLGLLVAGGGGLQVADMVALAERAEESGYDGVFVPESLRSGVATVAAIAAATDRVEVGPYVLNAHARTPLSAGMEAIDLDQLSQGRLVLGVGSGNAVMNESGHGVPVVRPLGKMRDYLEVLRQVTTAPAGTCVSYDGERHHVKNWRAQATLVRDSLPTLLAATSPRMMDLAADLAGGIALGPLQSASFVSVIAERLRARSPLGQGFAVYCAAFVAVDPDRAIARASARRAVVNLFAVKPHPHYERLLRLQGHSEFIDQLMHRLATTGGEGAEGEVPDEVVDDLTIAGTAEECAARIEQYSPSVNMLILQNVAALEQITPRHHVNPARLVASYGGLLDLASLRRPLPETGEAIILRST